jgi:hypothetical protein
MAETKVHGGTLSSGTLWFVGWLFTLGFVHLTGWKAALALLIWPYYLGVAIKS